MTMTKRDIHVAPMLASRRLGFRVLLLSLAALVAPASDTPVPNLEHLTAYGCSVELMPADQRRWHAYVWAEHDGKRDWKMLYTEHHGKNASKKCLNDCDAWMGKVRKLVENSAPKAQSK